MKVKVEPFLMKKGNRVAKAAIEFEESDSFLAGFHMVGFTICDDAEKGLFVLFPSSQVKKPDGDTKPFFFLRPNRDEQIDMLQDLIIDTYESMTAFNHPVKK